MPEMTENETPMKKQHRKKNRETHNAVERHRKKKINAGINRIGELIPCSPALKQSKNMILDQAFKYITEMKRQNDELLLNGGNNEQAEEIKKLRKQLDELQKENGRYIELLKANDICLYDDPTIHWKGNLKSAKVSVVIPSDQVQKNIIVYSNGSQPGGNNQGASVQGITFNVGHNLQKQTANVVPVQRTCNLVTPVTISGVYPTENKPWSQTTVSPLASSQPVPAETVLELSTSENEQDMLTSATASSQNACPSGTEQELQCSSSSTPQNDQNVPKIKNGQECTKLMKKTIMHGISIPSNTTIEASQVQQVNVSSSSLQDPRSEFQESFVVSATDTTCTPSVRLSIVDSLPSVNILKSTDLLSSAGVPVTSAIETVKAVTAISTLPAGSLDNCWSFSGSSGVGTSDLKNMSSLTRIPSAGITQTTWTTLQLAGNTVQPLTQTPSSVMTALLNEPVNGAGTISSTHNRHLAPSISLNSSVPGDGQAAEQNVVTLPSCPSVPMQPLITQPQVKTQPAGNIFPLNSAMQVIQMAQTIGSAVTAVPANQNVIILQPPNTTPCPPVVRAEVPSQTVSQQIVIIQAANQNSLPLLSAQPPGSLRVPVNGASPIASSNSSVQNASAPQTFGGKHLVHILPRPPSLPSSSATQTFSVTMSNQQQPQTISLNGQLFALQPMMSSSGASNQAPMQIIQPTTSEDPNTNVALNTFGALANLNQSISQMAGQSCLQLSLSQPTNPTTASSQIAPINCVSLPTSAASSIATESSTVLSIASNSINTSPKKASAGLPSNIKSKRTNKKTSTKKHLAANSKASCPANPCRDSGKLDCTNVEATAEHSDGERLIENIPVVSQALAVSQANSVAAPTDVSVSDCQSKETLSSEQMVSLPELSSTEVPSSSPLGSVMSEQFVLVPSSSKDSTALLQTSRNNPLPGSVLPESSKSCVTTSISMSSATEAHVTISQVSGALAPQNSATTDHASEAESISETCSVGQESSIVMQTTDLLEGQGLTRMLSDLTKERTAMLKPSFSLQVENSDFPPENSKTIKSNVDLPEKQELLLMNTEGDTLTQHHSCISDQEVVSGSLIASRQADSPMSTSSGSSRGFSVASMLPDTSREDVTSSTSTNTCNSCTFSEQTDIVALAARAIFDQENLEKSGGGIQVNLRDAASKSSEVAPLEREQQPFKPQTGKANVGQLEAAPNKFHAQDPVQTNVDRPVEKPSCSVGVETSNTVQISTSQSPNVTSLSVNNLIHQSRIIHPLVSCSGLSQPSEQAAVPATEIRSISSSSYVSQSPGSAMMTEYVQDQLSAIRANTMQAPQMQEPHLKQQNHESRKDSAKRAVQEDLLLSTAKRQKQCQTTPVRLEGVALTNRTPDSIADQTQMLVSQIPPNSSNPVVSVSNQGHTDGLNRLFPSNNNFVTSALRQTEVQCSSQPSISEQQGQTGGQHLQPIQHVPAQGVSHLHSNHPYLKQQQAGQLRERHHLYQLQHHVPHAESSVHSQSHSVHQQRAIQQEVQMQKKRSLVQGTQASQLSLQQKHHGNDQTRQKSGQPHPHHQQIQQQMQQHFGASQPEKNCENPSTSRNHHNHPQNHLNQDIMHHQQQDVGNRQQGSGVSSEHVSGHNQMQRLLTARGLEQQMVSQPSIVTRPSDMTCAPHRQERNRVSSYSAEALIGKTPSNSEQRIGISLQGSRVPDQLEMRSYLDVSRNKGLVIHNMQSRISVDHAVGPEVQRLSDCQTFKPNGASQQPTGNFDVQASRNSEIGNSVSSLRGMQSQAFRISQNTGPPIERQKRLPYQPVRGIPTGNALLPRDNENTCHQSFMQSLLAPHLGDQVSGSQRSISEHQRNTQCSASSTIEYNCPPARESVHIRRDGEGQNRESCDMSMGTINTRNSSLNIPFSSSSSSGDIQGRNTSPNISVQKSNPMRMTDSHGTKSHMNTPVSSNMHGVVRPALPHPAISHGNAEQGQPSVRQPNSSVTQRSRHPLQDNSGSKIRQPERNRSGNQRHGNVFDPSLPHLPLSTGGSMILGRQQSTIEKRGSIVRFMSDGPQVSNDNAAPDQHALSQNFGFPPFIPEGSMNPTINANTSFIPPVTQPSATRTPALIPVDPQNTLPSFYPPYSPAHPTLSNDISIPYFPNQMFPNPSTEKPSSGGLNNRFGSILSPPRPVGFAQPSFPLLPDMPPMHMTNTSHLSNFNLTSLFPEIATALPPDGSAMSPLLSIANTSASDSSKQSSNRPAHNISHILGHDCSSAV
ncbi:unnamed protein product [Natator depressus]|uniref:basic helix-loop-helix domain-containing protein USF3 n=1 Tax=Natator depressus TaxID=27790 RepID=UPI003D538C36